MESKSVVLKARALKKCIPAFNIPHLPMVEPIIQAVCDENSIAMIQVARVEWEKIQSKSLEHVAKTYYKYANDNHTLLHLDHIPVIDEDYKRVDYMTLIRRAIDAGFQSAMIDGSRLTLDENISVTREAADLTHAAGIPIEAELGAVMGHENQVMPPYDEIFINRLGFTKPEEAQRFSLESQCDWLSVAVGNIHGAVAEALRSQKKPEAKLDITHINALYKAAGVPLVLHGGSGIKHQYILDAIAAGIAKINVGTELRQAYESTMESSNNNIEKAQEQLYLKARDYIHNYLENTDLRSVLAEE